MNARRRIMVESRELEEAKSPDAEVAARWRKAVQTYSDAERDLLSPDSRLTPYYQAGPQAATALVRAAGYRVLGTDHHRHTFEALRALDLDGELSTIARELNAFRRTRRQAVYDCDATGPDDAAHASAASGVEEIAPNMGRMLDLGRAWLLGHRPAAAAALPSSTT